MHKNNQTFPRRAENSNQGESTMDKNYTKAELLEVIEGLLKLSDNEIFWQAADKLSTIQVEGEAEERLF
jgi:hypothetical protein